VVAQRQAQPRPDLRAIPTRPYLTVVPPTPPQRAYRPVGAALDLLYAKEGEVLLEGPAGTGKSRNGLEKLYILAQRYPGMRGIIARKTRASLTDTTLVTWEDKVLPEGSPVAAGPQREQRHSYKFPNGSEIVVGGMDKPSKIMSSEYDVALLDEGTEFSEDDVESITTRLRNGVIPYQQLIVICNPGPPTHWLNQRANRGAMRRLLSRHEDNPRLFRNGRWTPYGLAYIAKLDALTGVRKKRLRRGIWAAADGMVYDDYDPAIHLIDRFEIPATWRRIRSIDFGYSHAFVCQWWAIDGDGRMYRYREIYRTGRLVRDHAAEIAVLSAGETYEATISDHDAEDRATLHDAGIWTTAAHKAVSTGIQAVQGRLAKAGDGRPRLFLLRDSLVARDEALAERYQPCCTEEEVEGYVWAKGAGGVTKEEPVKHADHGMDTTRYAVAYVDDLGSTQVQALDIPGFGVAGGTAPRRERQEFGRRRH